MSDLAAPLPPSARRIRRPSLLITLCGFVVCTVIVSVVLGERLAPQDPGAQDLSNVLTKPSSEHWLGTDELGRDVFSRLIAGARSAFLGPLVIALGSAFIGTILGLYAGYRGGRTDALIMRWVDLMWAVPGVLVVIVVAGVFGGGYWFAVALLVVLTTPFDTRVVRAATLEQVPRPYVEAAVALGVPDRRIILSHIWPNVSSVVVVNVFLGFAGALVVISGLSFLGLSVPPGTPDWGLMLAEGRTLLFANPVGVLAPAVMIVLLAISMNLMGDAFYERLTSRGATR